MALRLEKALRPAVVGAMLLMGGAAAGLSGCSLPGDAVNGYYAPLSVLPDSDVAVETNLKTAATGGDVSAGQPTLPDGIGSGLGGAGDDGGGSITAGPSTSASVISEDSSGTDTALVGFNPRSHDCLGLLDIGSGGLALLGQSVPGSYYFWVKNTSSPACDAASFLAVAAVPTSWPKGDPSGSGWPMG